MKSRAATCALVAVALLIGGAPAPRAGGAAVEKDVTITLKISDKASGFSLEAKKKVAKDSNAFDAVRHVVTMAYRTDAELGPIVTSLCGVSAAKGTAWSCSIDGQTYQKVGNVKLNADVTIEWKTVPTK